jgi:DNA-binding NarL/FixJ family response regulator
MLLQITPVERAALQLLAEGRSHAEIATCLETSTREVKATLSVLFSRLGVRTPADAIRAGLKRGLLTVTSPSRSTTFVDGESSSIRQSALLRA